MDGKGKGQKDGWSLERVSDFDLFDWNSLVLQRVSDSDLSRVGIVLL